MTVCKQRFEHSLSGYVRYTSSHYYYYYYYLSIYLYMGRAVRKGPLGHKISKMSFHRHVVANILKNFGVQTIF